MTRYYTVQRGQSRYFYGQGYELDHSINCLNDCFKTADGTDLHYKKPWTVLACPPELAHGTKLWVEGFGIATCHDRGGAIKGARLDMWAGAGDLGLDNIDNSISRSSNVYQLSP